MFSDLNASYRIELIRINERERAWDALKISRTTVKVAINRVRRDLYAR